MTHVNWGDVPTWLATAGAFIAAGAALWQLRLQRIQLADETRVREREQANAVDVTIDSANAGIIIKTPEDKNDRVRVVQVANNSNRPIRDLTCRMEGVKDNDESTGRMPASAYGVYSQVGSQKAIFGIEKGENKAPLVRAGAEVGFVWSFTIREYPLGDYWVRFTDDAGLHWEITSDLHLEKLKRRDW